MKIYRTLNEKNKDGKWYEIFEVPDDFPLTYGYTAIEPPSTIRYPKWDYGFNEWVEDKDSVIDSLKLENGELTDRINMTESALLDLADMILSR